MSDTVQSVKVTLVGDRQTITAPAKAVVKAPDSQRGPWEITAHWARVDGRAVIVGLDVRSFAEHTHPDGTVHRPPVGAGLVEVTQRVLRELESIEEVRDSTRWQLQAAAKASAQYADRADLGEFAAAAAAYASAVTASDEPRQRRPPVNDVILRRVASLYREAVAEKGVKAPAKYVEEQLREGGMFISERSGRAQVRKWIQRARERGFIPPVGHHE